MTRGRFAEAAQAFLRIMPEQREAVLQVQAILEIKGSQVQKLPRNQA